MSTPGPRGLCPKRWMGDHRDCDRCDDEAVLIYGQAAVAGYLPAERVRAAVRRLVGTVHLFPGVQCGRDG